MIKRLFVFMILLFAALDSNGQGRETLLLQISKQKDDTIKVGLYKKLSEVCETIDYSLAMEHVVNMEKLSKKLNYKLGIEESQGLKGRLYYFMGKPDEALASYRRQLQFESLKSSAVKKSKAYNNLGLAFQQKQQFDSAFIYFDKSLEQGRKAGSGKILCAVMNNMGLTLHAMGNVEKSVGYFEMAYQCMLETNDSKELPTIINNLASLYAMAGKKNPDRMLLDLLSGPKLTNDVKATVYLNLGAFYFRNDQISLAESYFLKADALFRKQNSSGNDETLHSLGSIYLRNKQYEKALVYLKEAEKDFPNYSQKEMLYSDLASANFYLKRFDEAKFYYEKLMLLKDSKREAEIRDAYTKAQQNLNFIKKESEIKTLKYEKELLEAGKLRTTMTTFGLLAALILLGAMSWIYFKKERSKRKLNEMLLEQKNQKINDFTEKIAQRNRIIDEIENKFSSYKDQQSLQELKTDIIDSLDVNGGDIFNHYFDDQHKGFYTALKNLSPELTNNDLRLCSLTKLRMSLKETANVLNLSVDAVKSGRYRIRKKLGIAQDESLSDYLNTL